jgi:hypothetical protein
VPIGAHAKRATWDPDHVVAPWLAVRHRVLKCRVDVDLRSHFLISLPKAEAFEAHNAPDPAAA